MFAAFFAITMTSIQKGTWQHTIESMLHNYTGYIQIHALGYSENQSIDLLLENNIELIKRIDQIPQVDKSMTRLENFALISAKDRTKGVMIVGVEPQAANEFSGIEAQLIEGRYLQSQSNDVIIGKNIASNFQLNVNDTILGISQGYHGNNAVGKFIVCGILDFGNPDFNSQIILTPLSHAQSFYAADNLYSTIVLSTKSIDDVPQVANALSQTLDSTMYEVRTYKEMIPSLIEVQLLDKASSRIILAILYILIGFGILGTVLMMLHERNFEFCVLKAIGMKSYQLFWMIFIEILSIGFIGLICGSLLAFPILIYLYNFPIELGEKITEAYARFNIVPLIKASIDQTIFFEQSIIIFIMVLFISFYPYIKITQLDPVKGMRQ
ncbi:hypothetical protein GCM10025777_58300 [Membranihabitans marinus]